MVRSGVRSGDYEKLVDREVRASIQRMQAAEDAKQQGLRTWRLPESLKVRPSCFIWVSGLLMSSSPSPACSRWERQRCNVSVAPQCRLA